MNKATLTENLTFIKSQIELSVTIDNPTGIMDKLNNLTNLLGLSSECYAWSEKIYNERISMLAMNDKYKDLSSTDKKLLFAGFASEEIYNHSYAERLNKSLVHGIDGLRSMLSFLKEELNKS